MVVLLSTPSKRVAADSPVPFETWTHLAFVGVDQPRGVGVAYLVGGWLEGMRLRLTAAVQTYSYWEDRAANRVRKTPPV